MKADPFAQLKLLDVQELDSRLDVLRHQIAHLPETAELAELAAARAELVDSSRDLQVRVDDLTREQKKADADVEQVRSRRNRDQDRLDRGLVTSPRDLERLQSELVSLHRRISELEDVELEVMEQLETAQQELGEVQRRLAALEEQIDVVTRRRDERAGSVQQEAARVASERAAAAEGLPSDLMTLYDRLRSQKGGVGAAALRARRCGGCSLELNSADLAAIAKAPSDEVVRCEECSRILVRTHESGL